MVALPEPGPGPFPTLLLACKSSQRMIPTGSAGPAGGPGCPLCPCPPPELLPKGGDRLGLLRGLQRPHDGGNRNDVRKPALSSGGAHRGWASGHGTDSEGQTSLNDLCD